MNTNRRSWLKGATLFGSGFLSRIDRAAAAQTSAPSLKAALRAQATGVSEKLLVPARPGEEGPPALLSSCYWPVSRACRRAASSRIWRSRRRRVSKR